MMKKIIITYILIFFIATPVTLLGAAHTIIVSNQEDFNNLNQRICSLLENSNNININVFFSQGIYKFHNDHLKFANVDAPDATISFEGNGSIIISDGKDYGNGDVFTDEITMAESFVTTDGRDFNSWSKILRTSNSLIEVVDEEKLICRLNVSDLGYLTDKNEDECRWMYIWIPQWYFSQAYKVNKIESGYIYFTTYSINNINNDFSYGKISQLRFRLSNNLDEPGDILINDSRIYLPESVDKVRQAKATRLMKICNSKLKTLSLNGFKIYGNAKKGPYYPDNKNQVELIDCNNFKCDGFMINDCEFKSIQSRVINLISTNNVTIESCIFEDCYSYGIFQERSSSVLCIHGCKFHNVNKRINNTFAISCRGADFYIYDNVISDFGYGAIQAGNWYGHSDVPLNCNGVIERNELFFTQPYFEYADEHNLMDSGAIYLFTIANSIIIRYNIIHHYGGARDNHGIFCDDGAKNFKIYGNTITNLLDGNSIDSRRVASLDSKFGGVNINNVIRDNIVDKPIRFQGNQIANNGCIFEGNIHLDGNSASDIISNVNQ